MNLAHIAASIGRSIAEAIDALPAVLGPPPPTRGPELITTPAGTGWTAGGTGASTTSGALVWNAANNLASNSLVIATEDNVTYEVIWTIDGYAGGSVRPIIYGATTAHAGLVPSKSANGTYTDQVTTNGAGSNTLRIWFQATGTTGTNTFNVTSVSVKKVLP